MKNISTIFVLVLVLVSPALADGFYGAIDLGVANGNDICAGSTQYGWVGCGNTLSMRRVAIGYQFTPAWGTELSIGAGERATLGVYGPQDPNAGKEVAGWRISTLTQISATGTLPLGNSFDLIGKVGIAQTMISVLPGNKDVNSTTNNVAVGIGAQYSFTDSIALRAQYEDLGTVGDTNTGTTKMTLITAGVVYSF